MTTAPSAHGARIAGLDAWRAVLLMGGILLHGSLGLADTPLFAAIDIVSQTFRMGTFFGIAGVLSALALERHRPGAWLRRRVVQLGIPLCFGLATFPPLLWKLAKAYSYPGTPIPMPFDWYHLWFLAALLGYSGVAYMLVRRGLDTRIADRLERGLAAGRLRATTILLVTTLACAALFAAAPPIMRLLLPAPLLEPYRTLQLVAGYLPMFLLGYAAMRVPALGGTLLAGWRISAAVVVFVAVTYLLWFLLGAPLLSASKAAAGTHYLRFIAGALCPPAAFVLILRSALSIGSVPPTVTRLAAASYTMYLLHLPVAIALNLTLRPFGLHPFLSYAVAVIGSATAGLLVHEAGVRRSATLALLLNGHVRPRRSHSAYLTEQP